MLKKVVLTTSLGTILEWAEYAFYAYLATEISTLFFPNHTPAIALLATFGVFAVGYFMRPLGALVFSHIGDTKGRKTALMISMLLMGMATFAMGILPTYDTIGIMAPILLLLCRALQGFAVSGELNSAYIYAIEHSKNHNAYGIASIIDASCAAGVCLGGLAAYFVSISDATWAWRVPFLVGAASCVITYYLRTHLHETPIFENLSAEKKETSPIKTLFKHYRRESVVAAALAAWVVVYLYVGNTYLATYMVNNAGVSSSDSKLLVMLAEFFVMILLPIVGFTTTDKNAVPRMKLGLLLAMFLSPLMFITPHYFSFSGLLAMQLAYAIVDALVLGPLFKYLYDLFPPEVRVSGNTVNWSLSAAFIGGTAPLIAASLYQYTQFNAAPGLYVTVWSGIVFVTLHFYCLPHRSVQLGNTGV